MDCIQSMFKASDKSYKIYRFMIIKTELADENPSHWPSSIVPNTSLSVYSFGPKSGR